MKRSDGIKWMFFDLDSYFASVEQQENASLRGKPVAVVPTLSDYTCVIAASYEAKLYGIRTGTSVKKAKSMCPALKIVPARHHLYVAYHNKIISEIAQHIPINKIWSIDELSSLLPPGKQNTESAQKISIKVREGLWRNIGEHIHCSIGLAPNALLAKIACSINKPKGFCIIPENEIIPMLQKTSLSSIPGIGNNMLQHLNKNGIHTTTDFLQRQPKDIRKIWGSIIGESLWYSLHGYDFQTPEMRSTSSIGHSQVIAPEYRTTNRSHPIMCDLTLRAAKRLKKQNFYVRNISLSLRTALHEKWMDDLHIRPTQNALEILQHTNTLWRKIMQHLHNLPQHRTQGIQIKKISVCLHNLCPPKHLTGDLFEDNSALPDNEKIKLDALDLAIEKLHNKYGASILSVGLPPKKLAEYTGTKIAFTRVPDMQEFSSAADAPSPPKYDCP